jgi:hypothetical protein
MDTVPSVPDVPSDIITQGIEFLKIYWDDIAVIVIIGAILFLYVLLSGIELKGISDDPESIAKGVRKLLFPIKGRSKKVVLNDGEDG